MDLCFVLGDSLWINMATREDIETELQALINGELEIFEPPEIIEERIQKAIEQSKEEG